MQVVYRGRSTEGRFVQITPDYDVFAPWGVPVELPDEIAARVLKRDGWSTHKAGKAGAPKE